MRVNILFHINHDRHKNIYCRLSKQGCRKSEIATGLHVNPSHWQGAHLLSKSIRINKSLQAMKFEIEDIIFKLEQEDKQAITPALIKQLYQEKAGAKALRFADCLDEAFKNSQASLAANTSKGYKIEIRDFKAFLADESLSDIKPHSLDVSLVDRYIRCLRLKNIRFSSISVKIARLKTLTELVIIDAASGMTDNPFKQVNLKITGKEAEAQIDTGEKWLDIEDQNKLEELKLNSEYNYIRNMFLFQVNTGLAWVDMDNFNVNAHIVIDLDGDRWIRLRRRKTIKSSRYSEIPLTEATAKLIEYFKRSQQGETLINNLGYALYARRLYSLAKIAGIHNLTSHMARHTFGVRMLENGVPMESVSHMMGHSSISITERVYAKVTKRKLKIDLKSRTKFA